MRTVGTILSRRKGLQKRLNRLTLAITEVDLNGDGNTETVIKYNRSGPCDEVRAKHAGITGVGAVYLVTDNNLSEVMPLNSYTVDGEIFIHLGTAYFDQVHYNPSTDEYLLFVQHPVSYNGDPNSLCDLKFRPDKCPANQRPKFGYATVCKFIYQKERFAPRKAK